MPHATTTSTIPSCMELAPYPSLLSHMRTPPAKELMFSRMMPSRLWRKFRYPVGDDMDVLMQPRAAVLHDVARAESPYRILLVNALKKRCGLMFRVR